MTALEAVSATDPRIARRIGFRAFAFFELSGTRAPDIGRVRGGTVRLAKPGDWMSEIV